MLATVREHIISLLLSELTVNLFNDGSETDQSFWTGLGGGLAMRHFASPACVDYAEEAHERGSSVGTSFDFQAAIEALLRRFSGDCNPATKLGHLLDIDSLLELRQNESAAQTSESFGADERQLQHRNTNDSANAKIAGFRSLFSDGRTRPAAIFRDLQYIAALVPSLMTETSPQSTAFWHAAVAITGLKKELCTIMVETADSIIAYHSNNRGHGRSPSSAQQQRDSATFAPTSSTPPAEDVAKYSMSNAAHLLQITAKEGDAVAQRELATLYLTNPELMDHIIAPFARPREVFKEELESKWRKNQDPNRCDPVTMCVAHHWMSLSAKGGDALAKEYLKQREEMDAVGP